MKHTSVLIVEDDFSFALEIEMKLKKLGFEIVGNVHTMEDTLRIIQDEKVDVILLDLNLHDSFTGMELGKKIKQWNIPVIIMTAYKDVDIFEEAMEIEPVGFLVKPFDLLSLRGALENARKQTRKESESVFLKYKGKLTKVYLDDIFYLEAEGNYTVVMTEHKKFVLRISLTRLMERIKAKNLQQVHRGSVVNLDKIQEVNLKEKFLKVNGHTIPIGRKYKKDLSDRLTIF